MKNTIVFITMLALGVGTYTSVAVAQAETIKKCGNISAPASYILVKNLTATGDCLVVLSDSVTIDLNGFTITGSGAGNGIQGQDGITILNGTIRNFNNGISLGLGAHVKGVHVDSNANNGMLVGESSILTGNIAMDNGNRGFAVGPRSIVTGNTASFNGIGINVGAFSLVRNNTADNNTGSAFADGIAVGGGVTVIGNNASANEGRGIVTGASSTVLQNTVRNNTGFGLICSNLGSPPGPSGFADNVISGNNGGTGNPQVSLLCLEIGTNICDQNTTCP